MPDTHHRRREALRRHVEQRDADGALVTSLVNIRYLTGFTGSNAALLVTQAGAVLATDGRYVTQAQQQSPDVELVVERACAQALVALAGENRLRRLAFESHVVSVESHRELLGVADVPELIDLEHAVEALRVVKDDSEVALLREACAISDRALAETLDTIAPGQTEREVALRLESCMVELGADAPAFESIVATGSNSAIPHHRPTGREIERGDLLKIDFGALYQGYHADCTRTLLVGREPEAWQKEIYDVVRAAQRAGRHALAVDADVRDVDAAARAVVTEAGYGEQFPHGLGHGVGLEIHEAPLLGYQATGRLAARTPLTVEPGVYLPGRGGVRIEDTLVVGDGAPELLTTTPKDLLVL
ncbi:MAG TPA: Xaa-Pro peptidase family protein [Nocardioidaceae bacterium]|nr:Xaa-Pro peptidase family protein [Nocardioidaceae bacterium]